MASDWCLLMAIAITLWWTHGANPRSGPLELPFEEVWPAPIFFGEKVSIQRVNVIHETSWNSIVDINIYIYINHMSGFSGSTIWKIHEELWSLKGWKLGISVFQKCATFQKVTHLSEIAKSMIFTVSDSSDTPGIESSRIIPFSTWMYVTGVYDQPFIDG